MFSIRNWMQGGVLRQVLAAAALVVVSAGAGADTRVVTQANLEQVERAWVSNPELALSVLENMQAALQQDGEATADIIPTISDVYWRHARATQDRCATSYRSLYQATALGFREQWTHRLDAYDDLAHKLQQCLPEAIRKEIGQEAWGALRSSKLRDLASIQAVNDSGLNGVVDEPARQVLQVLPPEPASSATAATSEQSEVVQVSVPTAAPERDPVLKLENMMRVVMPWAFILAVFCFILSIYNRAMADSTGASAVAAKEAEEPAKPAKTAKRSGAVRALAMGATKSKSARLVRLRPWE